MTSAWYRRSRFRRFEASLCGGSALSDPPEGDLDLEFVDDLGIVIVEPPSYSGWLGSAAMSSFSLEPRNATAILGRGVASAGDVAWIADVRLARAGVHQDQPVLPAVTEVVDVGDGGFAGRQQLAEADRAREP